jgi:hypothetical protein
VSGRLDRAGDAEPRLADGGDVWVPADERHVVRASEEAADETAQTARAEDEYLHRRRFDRVR